MLDYGLDRVTNPNEDQVNQVSLLRMLGRAWARGVLGWAGVRMPLCVCICRAVEPLP